MSMIQVDGLTKIFGSTIAIERVSFDIPKGQLVGFLGKNGAGKSTTMRILTGSLGATEGTATIGGFDVAKEPRKVKELVGYLPESPPLYQDMTVRGYLRFAAKIKNVKPTGPAVQAAIDRTGLGPVAHRLIGNLSKGYRQRVGIAQAIVHNPPVLILDEPLSGLDPAQRREIRDLVKQLSDDDTTVVLSTHVLTEIESLCDRVIIIHEGKLVVQDTVQALSKDVHEIGLVVARPDELMFSLLRAIEGVTRVDDHGGHGIIIASDRDVREAAALICVRAGLLEMRKQNNLEDAFLRLTSGAEA
jgi:ABC-2 type transport system ATP-binding protein